MTANTALTTTQGATQRVTGALPGPLRSVLDALHLDAVFGTLRRTLAGAFFAVRAFLLSLTLMQWIRLIAQWTPTVVASVWIGAQLRNRMTHRRARARRR